MNVNVNVFKYNLQGYIDSKGMCNDRAIFRVVFLYKSFQNGDIMLLTQEADIATSEEIYV